MAELLNRRVAAVAAGVLFALALAPSAPAALRPSIFVKASGSDSASCSRYRPCRTFNRAYRKARPGQTVHVAGGAYPGQRIWFDGSKTSPRDVTFVSTSRSPVVVHGEVVVAGRHVAFRGMRFAGGWQTRPSARDVTFSAIRTRHLFIFSGSRIRVFGGHVYPGPNGADYDSMISTRSGSRTPPSNILISRVRFHGWVDVSPSQANHIECLQIGSGVNLTIRKSRFWKCGTHDIFIRSWGTINGGNHPLKNIRIENNFFGRTTDGYYAIQLVDDLATSRTSFLVRNNSSLQPFHDNVRRGTIRFSGNAIANMSSWECGQSFRSRWHHNVFGSGRRCGWSDRVGRLRFMNPATLDLRLRARSAAINRGDPDNYPRTDIQGQRRPRGGRPDAGADERT
jgi:hypothetical protein